MPGPVMLPGVAGVDDEVGVPDDVVPIKDLWRKCKMSLDKKGLIINLITATRARRGCHKK